MDGERLGPEHLGCALDVSGGRTGSSQRHQQRRGALECNSRRWTASELGGNTWLGVQWNVRKENLAGTGVTGALHVNGVRVQSAAVAGNDGVGVTQTYWVIAKSTMSFT